MQSKRYLALLTACSMALAGTASAGGKHCGMCANAKKGQGASMGFGGRGWQSTFDYDRQPEVVSIWILNPTTGKWEEQKGGSQAARTEAQTFEGTIEGFRHVTLKDRKDRSFQNTLVKLNLESGRTVVADLGPRENLSKLNLEKGDEITLSAKTGVIRGRPILFAQKISHEGSSVDVKRGKSMDKSRTAKAGEGADKEMKRLSGTISDFRAVSLKGSDQKHTLIQLKTDEGKTKLVDLGPHTLTELGLEKNDHVNIRGKTAKINGKPVVMASKVLPSESKSGTAASEPSRGMKQEDATSMPGRSSTSGEYGVTEGSSTDASRSSGTVTTPQSGSSSSQSPQQNQGSSSQQQERSGESGSSEPSIETRDQSAF